MKYSGYILLTLSVVTFSTPSQAEEVTFNGFADGPLHTQQGWWADKEHAAGSNFFVVDRLGFTSTLGDKALVISKSEAYLKISRKKSTVPFKPADTFEFNLDFQFGLNGGHVETAQNGLAILFGDPDLKVGPRWVLSIGINPSGKWLVRGNLPHWENLPALPAETFVTRPGEGESAVSPWFHLKLTGEKSQTPNVFRVKLLITDVDGNTVLEHAFKETPVEGDAATLWSMSTMSYGFSAKDDINGLVCVDNINLTSIPGKKTVTSLKDLL